MNTTDEIDSTLEEILPANQSLSQNEGSNTTLNGKFQVLSSLGGYLGVYKNLTTPNKDELIATLYDLGVRNAPPDSVYHFLQVDGEDTTGFIRSKNGEWIEQAVDQAHQRDLSGNYSEYAKLASFLGLYERYGLEQPNGTKLRQALVNYGVRNAPDMPDTYLAPVEDSNGSEHLIGITPGKVTTAFPVDTHGHRIGEDEYTRDLLPKLISHLESADDEPEEEVTPGAVPPLSNDVENLLDDYRVAENYQLIMHRIAEQAAGENVPESVRSQKLAEARFITEVLTGEKPWETGD